ncbi:MAG TPA: AAA family ATPase [Rubrivivax sp.]|nr:AAA family ATPase [Rubrivivax sp.]
MPAVSLSAQQLALRCDPALLAGALPAAAPLQAGTGAAPAPAELVGQPRARAAIEFGLGMCRAGYHLVVTGAPGTGKRSLVRRLIEQRAPLQCAPRSDWVYVNNFAAPHQPVALQLAAGRGAQLREHLRALVEELRSTIPAAFESEEYAAEVERLNGEFKERVEHGLIEVGDQAQAQGLVMVRTPVGFTFAPQKGSNEVMSPQEFEALPQAERTRLQQAMAPLQERLLQALRESMRLRKEHAERVRALNRSTTQLAVDHAVDDSRAQYADVPAVLAYLDAVRAAVLDNADAFRSREDADANAQAAQADALARFEVNLVVDAGGRAELPVVDADLPSYQNLVGRVDHMARFGMLVTDFRFIKAGLLHRANGGYLLLDAVKLLTQPFAWAALKRALLAQQVRIESMAEMVGMVSTVQLEPQPIPLDLKVVLFCERALCQMLQAADPEFGQLFRVVADMDDELPRDAGTQRALAATLAAQAQAAGLLAPDAPALARLIDHGARRSGDAQRISAEVRVLLELLHEADHLASSAARASVGAADVAAAIAARRERASRVDARMREAMLRDILNIATSGSCVGQINGLAAYGAGGETFGAPSRITATSRLGDGQLVDIQRETRMGGPVHAKGVLILSSFLAARFSRVRAHSIVASLVFEQTYGLVEGDSASMAELVALMSSIGGLPLRQNLAMTGSVDQFGNAQAVGAINEKIEGFFDLCAARGLDGSHGAILPHSNAAQLMLRDDVVRAVADGRFHVHAVHHVDDALELLSGLPAGDPCTPADDTANGRIAQRLREFAALRRGEQAAVRAGGRRAMHAARERGARR